MRLLAFALVALVAPGASQADDLTARAEARARQAMEHFDLGEAEAARDQLVSVLEDLEDAGLGEGEIAARANLLLGVVYGAGLGDSEAAMEYYARALTIDRRVELGEDYADESQRGIFRQAVASLAARPPRTIDCAGLDGLAHHAAPSARAEEAHKIACHAGAALREQELLVYYAASGDDFREATLKAGDGCAFSAEIPAHDVTGESLSYYFIVRDDAGEVVAVRGSPERPYVIPLVAPEPKEPIAGEPDKPRACGRCHTGQSGVPAGAVVLLAAAWLAFRHRRRS